MEDLNTDQELPTAVKDARNQLEEHKDLRKSILELSMETLSKGQVLLEKLREASSRADLNSRHAAKSACYGIERTLEALQGRRRKLEEVWKHRKHLLEQCVRSCKLDDEIKRVCMIFFKNTVTVGCHLTLECQIFGVWNKRVVFWIISLKIGGKEVGIYMGKLKIRSTHSSMRSCHTYF